MNRLQAAGIAIKSVSNSLDEQAVLRMRNEIGKPAAPTTTATPPVSTPSEPTPPATPAKESQSKSAKPEVKPPELPAPEKAPVSASPPEDKPKVIIMRGAIIVRELAEQLGLKPNQLITELMMMNIFASINERVDLKVAQQLAEKHGILLEHEKKLIDQKSPIKKAEDDEEEPACPEDLEIRPPVVTFLGHIDHGKTSLLDRIRNTSVAKSEAGGITQHIGAYTIEHHGRKITFLDTPGHAAFTAMRARGANLTDIAIIVIAADDGIMPQTEEAIKHAQAAQTTIIAAINKMDLPAANPDRVKKQLQAIGLPPEDWGGTVICCPVSAQTGKGIDHLLEMILLQSEMLELKATHKGRAEGYTIEAQMEPGMGPTAHLMVTRGTLHVGDVLVCGPFCGRVKALINDHGIKIRTALPSTPVKCLGLSGVPQAGEKFKVYVNEKTARELVENRGTELRVQQLAIPKKASLQDLFAEMSKSQQLELRLILKCDTQGSLEAIQKALGEIKSDKVAISFVLTGVGNINENDVLLASASAAIIIGFNISKENGAVQFEKREGVEIRLYSIIYDIVDQIREAMTGMLAPELREKFVGKAEVRQIFPISKKGAVAGCLMINGRVGSRCKARVVRKGDTLYEGSLLSLRRFQDDVSEVREGQECGIRLDNYSAFEAGDSIEFFEVEKFAQKL
ncbi:MAG: translation initiation factor IF-2 [Kiritimatiellae bacterium]|nr:translation initiation factor IF-2 [Kiritimatiellia bacterium]